MTEQNKDPNLHRNGKSWLRWDGTQWVDADTGQPAVGGPGVPPVPSGRKGKGCLIAAAIAGGIFSVLIIGVAVAGGGNQSKSSGTSSPSASGAPTALGTDAPSGSSQIGQPVRDGKFEFTITKVAYAGKTVGSN